jgi:trans-aconitate methyltransferase
MNPASAEWHEYVEHVVEALDVGPGTSVFDVGCGEGAFLYPLWENQFIVGGLEPSAALAARAKASMPEGEFLIGEAASLDPAAPWDVVLSSAFARFPDLDYARGVLARMAAKATHAVAILNLPERLDDGSGPLAGGLQFDRHWVMRTLAGIGAAAVRFEHSPRALEPGPARFDVFARLVH